MPPEEPRIASQVALSAPDMFAICYLDLARASLTAMANQLAGPLRLREPAEELMRVVAGLDAYRSRYLVRTQQKIQLAVEMPRPP